MTKSAYEIAKETRDSIRQIIEAITLNPQTEISDSNVRELDELAQSLDLIMKDIESDSELKKRKCLSFLTKRKDC